MKKQLTFAAIAAIGALTLTACTAPAAEPGAEERLSLTMGMASEDTYTAEWWGWLAADTLSPQLVAEFNERMNKPQSPLFWTEGHKTKG